MTKAPDALSDPQVISLYPKPLNVVVQLLEERGYQLQKIYSISLGFHNHLDTYLHPHDHKIVIYHDGKTVKKARGYYKGDEDLEKLENILSPQ